MKNLFYFAFFLIIGMFCSCSEHNPNCKKLAKLRSAEKQYLAVHTANVGNVNVYVENSGSMDGYVNGNTEFKTDLFNILKLLCGKEGVNKYFINSKIILSKLNDNEFSNGMSVKLFQEKGGNRESSNIAELIDTIINKTDTNGISVFVSDCVFDPQNDPNIEKRLGQQKTIIQTAIKNKLATDSLFGVVVYRLMSSFSGYYYNKVKPHILLNNVQRPYYIWLFGDANRLAKARELLKKDLESKTKEQIYVQTNCFNGLPYYCPSAKCNLAMGKHIDEPQIQNNKFSFSVRMDFSTLPYDDKYLSALSNYELPENSDYSIVKVKNCKKNGKYTHELRIIKNKGNVKDNTMLHIVLKQPKCPKWVTDFNDSKGEDFMNGTVHNNARTFGLKSYIDGISGAYPDNIANFYILIK